MTAFISHSFENKPEFENVTDALQLKGIEFWNPAEIRPGASLREQLRAAVDRCKLCIFIATRRSIESSWCGAELGAFWGASKPIIVYLAEASLKDDELPQIVQGDVWERRISRIADRAREITDQSSSEPGVHPRADSSISQLTVEQLERMIVGAVSLAAATLTEGAPRASFDEVSSAARNVAGKVLAGFQTSETVISQTPDDWHNQILWVDDRPENNVYERRAMESMGLEFTLAWSTETALKHLSTRRFAAIISDMGRREGPREGYALLEALRATDRSTPFFIYAGSSSPEHRREAAMRGAQGSTNAAGELVEMVTRALRPQNVPLLASDDAAPGRDIHRETTPGRVPRR
jgi:CheY-like chemotaxis protein